MKCKALYDFVAADTDEISVSCGDILEVVAEDDGAGWILVKLNDQQGLVPTSYIEYISKPDVPVKSRHDGAEEERAKPTLANLKMQNEIGKPKEAGPASPHVLSPHSVISLRSTMSFRQPPVDAFSDILAVRERFDRRKAQMMQECEKEIARQKREWEARIALLSQDSDEMISMCTALQTSKEQVSKLSDTCRECCTLIRQQELELKSLRQRVVDKELLVKELEAARTVDNAVPALVSKLMDSGLASVSSEELANVESTLEKLLQRVRDERHDRTVCVSCAKNKRSIFLLPCKHLCVCDKCSVSIKKCPMCKQTVKDRGSVFMA